MSCGQDQTVTEDPVGVLGIMIEENAIQIGTQLGTTQGEPRMTRVGFFHHIDRETSDRIGNQGKRGPCVIVHRLVFVNGSW
jgi:hypothetical protein